MEQCRHSVANRTSDLPAATLAHSMQAARSVRLGITLAAVRQPRSGRFRGEASDWSHCHIAFSSMHCDGFCTAGASGNKGAWEHIRVLRKGL